MVQPGTTAAWLRRSLHSLIHRQQPGEEARGIRSGIRLSLGARQSLNLRANTRTSSGLRFCVSQVSNMVAVRFFREWGWTFGEWGSLVRRCLVDDESQWPKDRFRGRLTCTLPEVICNILGMTAAGGERYEHVIAILPADNTKHDGRGLSIRRKERAASCDWNWLPDGSLARVRRRHASGALAGRLAYSPVDPDRRANHGGGDGGAKRQIEVLLSPRE